MKASKPPIKRELDIPIPLSRVIKQKESQDKIAATAPSEDSDDEDIHGNNPLRLKYRHKINLKLQTAHHSNMCRVI